jgi:hypothetical protein
VPQDRNSGAQAAEWGRATARKIAEALGARSTSTASNEATYNAKRVVIKTAHQSTTSVGVTYAMLKRLDEVIAAWEVSGNEFDVWCLPAEVFVKHTRDSRSRLAAGKVGLVTRRVFEDLGRRIGTVRI